MVQSITFYLPEFAAEQAELRFLPKLISRARKTDLGDILFYPQLLHLLGTSNIQDISLASLTHPTPDSKYWLRADPIGFRQHLTTCTMQGNAHLQLSDDEVSQLLALANNLLAKDGLHLQATAAHVWHLALSAPPQIQTTPWEHILGREILPSLPQGEAKSYWRQLTTELQMLLYTSEVNTHRRAKRQPTVDSIWFWGEGNLPQDLGQERLWDRIIGCEATLETIAAKYQIPYQAAGSFESSILAACGSAARVLVVYPIRFSETRAHIDVSWFQTLIEALSKKTISQVTLIFGDGHKYELDARKFRRWWQIG